MLTPVEYRKAATCFVPCACCGSTRQLEVCRGDRHGLGIRTVACARCGFVFTNPRPPNAWYEEFYRSAYREFYDGSEAPSADTLGSDWIRGRHGRTIDVLAPLLPRTGRVLDIGCADGTFLHLFHERLPGWEVAGLEPSTAFAEFARTHYGLTSIRTGGFEMLREEPAGRYNLVTLGHVLEHLLEPNDVLQAVRRVLAPDGLVFIDVPDRDGEFGGIHNLHVAHVSHFSRRSLRNLLEKHGFEVVLEGWGAERPHWTIYALARRAAALPDRWEPTPEPARAVARAFRHHCGFGWRAAVSRLAARTRRGGRAAIARLTGRSVR